MEDHVALSFYQQGTSFDNDLIVESLGCTYAYDYSKPYAYQSICEYGTCANSVNCAN